MTWHTISGGAVLASEFALNWLIQSTVLLAVGLAAGRLVRPAGAAVQSAAYRATLAAVLCCPVASAALLAAGIDGARLRIAASGATEFDPVPATSVGSATMVEMAEPIPVNPTPRSVPLVDSAAVSPSAGWPGAEIEGGRRSAPTNAMVSMEAVAGPVVAEGAGRPGFGSGAMATAIGAAWMAGTFVLLLGLVVGHARMARLRGRACGVEPETADLARDLARSLGVAPPRVLRTPYLAGPCLCGLRRPTILLPEGEEDPREAIVHELAHLARRDLAWNLLRQVSCALLWVQPLIWALSRRIEATAEEVCDDVVVAHGSDRSRYAGLLLDIAERSLAPAPAGVGMVALRSMLARRVARILDGSRTLSTRAGRRAIGATLTAGLLGTMLVGMLGVGRPEAAALPVAEPPPPLARQEPDATDELFRRAIRGVEVYRNLQERAFYLSRIAAAQARQGDREAARRTYAQAREAGAAVRMDETMFLPHVLAAIARNQVASGLPDEARLTLREALRVAEEPPRKDNASLNLDLLVAIMGLQQDLGDDDDAHATYERALRFIETSDDRFISTFGADRRVEVQAAYGDFDAALQTLAEPELPPNASVDSFRDQSIGRIARRVGSRQTPDGRAILDRLREVADSIESPIAKSQTLQAIAEALVTIGEVDEALEVARSIDPAALRGGLSTSVLFNTARVLAVVGAAQARAGREEEARATFAEAVAMALGIEVESSRRGALAHIIRQQVEAGDDEGALRTAALIDGDPLRYPIGTMESIARRRQESGDDAAAREILHTALELAEEQLTAAPKAIDAEEASRHRNRIHAAIARLYGQLGEVEPAIEATGRINDAGGRIDALTEVARIVALSGDLGGALRVVEAINSPAGRAEAAEVVAVVLPAPL